MDIIDNAIGIAPLAAFPGSPYTGRPIVRTDLTNNSFVWTGAVWKPMNQIATFPTTAARTAGFPSPNAGDQAIVTADKSLYVYDGAAWLQTYVYGGVPQAKLLRTTVQTITTATDTAINWTSESIDTLNGHDNAVNNTRYTAQAGGQYLMIATVPWANNATGIRRIDFKKNGTTFYTGSSHPSGVATRVSTNASRILELSFGDYVEVFVHQTSGGNLDADGTLNEGLTWDIVWMGYRA